jgi:hypothetical protein
MKRIISKLIALGLLCAATTQASTTVIDFNSDPTVLGITLSGNATWITTDGLVYDATTNANDGYLQLTTAANSESATVIFPDFDSGAVVQGFTFDCWVRIGNGTTTPADGFSISYARAPVGTSPLFNSSTPGNSDGEEGTRTGIAVGFDAYDNGTTPPDPVALDIWVDGVLLTNIPMPTLNGLVTDPTSLQTGPNDGTGNPDILGWAHLIVTLSTNSHLTITYKNTVVLNDYPTGYAPGPGQLVMAGRTGGLNENQDVDEITITTTVAQNVLAGTATGIGDGVSVTFFDSGVGVVDATKPATVSIDGAAAVPASVVVKNGTTTSVIYYGYPIPFVAGSAHHVVATVTDVVWPGDDEPKPGLHGGGLFHGQLRLGGNGRGHQQGRLPNQALAERHRAQQYLVGRRATGRLAWRHQSPLRSDSGHQQRLFRLHGRHQFQLH